VDGFGLAHSISATAANLGHPINMLGERVNHLSRMLTQTVIITINYLDESARRQSKKYSRLQ
jgi:hypothetical protein